MFQELFVAVAVGDAVKALLQMCIRDSQQAYIGNVNSKKFHLPSCANLPAEKNQILFSSYDEAVAAGYSPCSSCIK